VYVYIILAYFYLLLSWFCLYIPLKKKPQPKGAIRVSFLII